MKKYLVTGVVILMPVALTLMIIFFLFDFFTGPFVPFVSLFISMLESRFHFVLPSGLALFISRLLALALLCIIIFVLGALARWLFLKNLFVWGHRIMARIPFINTVYKVSRDIFSAIFSSDGKKAFKYPVILPFPNLGAYSLGFRAGEVAEECQEKIKEPLVSVFMPTAPHPISGFLFLVEEKEVHQIEMNNEEALKFLVSCGMIHPNIEKTEIDEIL